MKEIFIDEENEGQRLDKLLFRYLNKAPRSFVFKMLRKKNIKLNKKAASPETKVKKGDIVTLFLSDETIAAFREKKSPPKVSADVDIIYEDKDIIIADKPVGLLSQADRPGGDCLNLRLISYMDKKGELRDDFVPSVCNRLDRNTRGLVTFGKTLRGARELSMGFREHFIKKYYLTVVKGVVYEEKNIRAFISKDSEKNIVTVGGRAEKNNAETSTYIMPVADNGSYTLLKIRLDTGKTHQIRAALSHEGLPVVGDIKYGDRASNEYFKRKYGLKNQFLICYEISVEPNGRDLKVLKNINVRTVCNEYEKNVIKAEFGLDF